jgi:hypothetical protein
MFDHKLMPMRTLIGFGSVVAAATLALVSACGDDQPESKVEGGAASSAGGSGNSAGTLNLAGTVTGGGSSSSGGTDTSFGGDGAPSCAAATQQAELAPVYLVFLLDESGSMGDGKNGDRKVKWDPVTSALSSFYADPASAGITASLSLFPENLNKTTGAADQNMPASCNKTSYDKPVVAPKALPDDKTFAAAIAALDPPNEYGTPTFPALSGTIDYAQTLLKQDAARKVAIVMVTDGEPFGCNGNTVDATAAAAMTVAKQIPTYVIGVGDKLDSLNAIAKGGGTDKAFIVALNNPEQTRTDLLDAINLIRGKSISCDLAIPPPPTGKKLDPNKVNVQFTGNGQPATSLKYGTECTGDTAWHYDDPAAPKSILLCDDTCTAVKSDPMGKLAVEFGCEDRVVVVQ